MGGSVTANDLMALLAKRHSPPAWAFLTQVRNQTGFRRRVRTADALAMSLYPSRGLELHGFEIKVARSDWKAELQDPDKAEEICQYCDRWWIVAPDGIVFEDDLPPTWGLLIGGTDKLATLKSARKLEPLSMSRAMLASILRNSTAGMVPRCSIDKKITEAYRNGEEFGKRNRNETALKDLRERVTKFEDTSGLKLNDWQLGNVAAAVKLLTDGGLDGKRDELRHLAVRARAIAKDIEEATGHE